jgi:hypothetical protein
MASRVPGERDLRAALSHLPSKTVRKDQSVPKGPERMGSMAEHDSTGQVVYCQG